MLGAISSGRLCVLLFHDLVLWTFCDEKLSLNFVAIDIILERTSIMIAGKADESRL